MKKTNVIERPPVVVVMGHVDHGKSALLDYIRKSNIVEGEAGGITQHISAYEVEHEVEGKKKKITFLDTPGHEAFGAIRARGASVADIAILVVSAEDGVKTQTLEALEAIKASDIPFVVAINKVDKPGADIMRTKSSLVEHAIYVEGMGGDISAVPVSAKTGEGIDELLDTILLAAELEEFTADTEAPAEAVVIEAHRDPKKGVAATLIVKNGTLRTGAFILADTALAPIRIMENFLGKQEKEISFSAPVRIIGFDSLPLVGTQCQVFAKKKEAEKVRDTNKRNAETNTVAYDPKDKRFIIPLIIKTDVIGTLEAIEHEIKKIENDRVAFKLVIHDVGNISESDIQSVVGTTDPIVIGFNVSVDSLARDVAYQHSIEITTFDIIYKMSEWLAEIATERTPIEVVEESIGEVKIIKVFSSQKNVYVLGGKVKTGVLKVGGKVRIVRRGEIIAKGEVVNLQTQKQNVEKVEEGNEFGAQIKSDMELIDGDRMEVFEMVKR